MAQLLHLMHPLAPFVTEELWQQLYDAPGGKLIIADWPAPAARMIDDGARREMQWLIEAISAVRAARAELRVPAGARLVLHLHEADDAARQTIERHRASLLRLARLQHIETAAAPTGALQVVVDGAVFAMPLAGIVDLDAERQRLEKEIARTQAEITRIERKLANENFLAKAPPEVVEQQRQRRSEGEATRQKLTTALARIA